jgi:tripartite-type tricarboxylate transporter receptor subunit TctC
MNHDESTRPSAPESRTRRIALAAGAGALLAGTGIGRARADAWPSKPVTLISPYNPGGTNDVPARIFAEGYEKLFGQRFLVRNQPGAAGIVGSKAVSAAAPDGYTLLSSNIGAMMVQSVVKNPPPYHPLRNFTPIVKFVHGEVYIGVNGDLPVKTVGELIALAKKEPGKLNYSSSGSGSFGNLLGEYFKMQTGTDIVHVPGKGSADAVLEMKSGRIHLMFDPIVLPQSADGRVRVLATTSRQRAATHPNIPTSVESGGPDISLEGWFGLFGPPSLPPEIVAKLEAATRTIAADPETKKKFAAIALVPEILDAAAFRARIESDHAVMSDIVAKAKLVVE